MFTGQQDSAAQDLPYLHWMMNVTGIGNQTASRLMGLFGSAMQVYMARPEQWGRVLKEKQVLAMEEARTGWNVQAEFASLQAGGIRLTGRGMADYPQRLLDIPDPPAVLYYRGVLPQEDACSVALIGARMCSEYGRFVAEKFAETLAQRGVQIISGLAAGIDGIGQAAACRAGGKSFAVLGCGVDICYPAGNRQLYDALLQTGGILSEYPPGTEPKPQLFPPRNRIISGLADLVLVVEAKEKSGTMITVDMALEQGREVYAVPGRVTDALQMGCHRLLRQGAGLAASPQDVLDALEDIAAGRQNRIQGRQPEGSPFTVREEHTFQSGRAVKEDHRATAPSVAKVPLGLSEEEKTVWDKLDTMPKSIESIWEEIRCEGKQEEAFLGIRQVMYNLIMLCAKGVAEQKGGAYSLVLR